MLSQEKMTLTCAVCERGSFFREHEGTNYCVLHLPSVDKKNAFDIAVKKKLDSHDFNFEKVWFPSGGYFGGSEITNPANFRGAVFNDAAHFYKTVFKTEVSFAGAVFNNRGTFEHVVFAKDVDFSSARFKSDANFENAKFEAAAKFWRCTFVGEAEFRNAKFLQVASFWPAIFESTASFYQASFAHANFRASEFKGKAVFSWCAFGAAEFTDARFNGEADFFMARVGGDANFAHAKFDASARFPMSEFSGEVSFLSATFSGETDFSNSVFKDLTRFSAEYGRGGFGEKASCDFRHTRFEAPGRVSFHSMRLRPHWFVNVEPHPQGFQFIDVRWIGDLKRSFIGTEVGELIKREEREDREAVVRRAEHRRTAEEYEDEFTLDRIKREESEEADSGADYPDQNRVRFYRLLSIACRQLADNAEENHRYEEASKFRYWAMDARRLETWRGFTFWRLSWWYWLASGYGERALRALVVLIALLIISAFLYTRVGFTRWEPRASSENDVTASKRDEVGVPLSWPRALTYSAGVMTLQKPEPRPATTVAQSIVILETVLGPLQVGLLALAIRRRFMR